MTGADAYDVVVLGAGYGGLMAALRLSGRNDLTRIALVNVRDEFVERIRLQEAIVRPVARRMPPLPKFLAGTKVEVVKGRVTALDGEGGLVRVATAAGERELAFRHCIYALGSHIDAAAARGGEVNAFRLEPGDAPRSSDALRRAFSARAGEALRVVVAGGGATGVEAAAEIKTNWPAARVTVASAGRVGDLGKGGQVEARLRSQLGALGISLLDHYPVVEVGSDAVINGAGASIAADICVWAGGLRAAPIAREAGLSVDADDRIWVDATLRSLSHPRIRAVGDAAHPTAPCGAAYRPSAFAAVISGAYAAEAILRERAGREPRPFSFSAYGQGVAVGRNGIGFFTYPDDGEGYFVFSGPIARRIRDLFVLALVFFLKLERRRPGLCLFWIGRRRVQWAEVQAQSSQSERPAEARAAGG